MPCHRRPPISALRFLLPALLALLPAAAVAEAEPDLELGRQLFMELAEPPCGICHTLADAEATGTIGPSLDALQPDAERVRRAVTGGPGVMPVYEGLSKEEIDAVAAYVAAVAGQN